MVRDTASSKDLHNQGVNNKKAGKTLLRGQDLDEVVQEVTGDNHRSGDVISTTCVQLSFM